MERPSPIERPLDPAEIFFHLLDRVSCTNFAVFAERAGHLDPDRLRDALAAIRTEDSLLQVSIARSPENGLRFARGPEKPIELRAVDTTADDWQPWIERELGRPFADGASPLVRCLYLQWPNPQRCVLALTFHHAIADGRSGTDLLRRLLGHLAAPRPLRDVSTAAPLPPMHDVFPARFRWAEQPEAAEQALGVLWQDYRRNGEPTRLPWLVTRATDRVPRFLRVVLPQDVVDRLLAASRQHGTSLHGALCAAHLLAEHRLLATTDRTRLFLSCPVDMRPHLSPEQPTAPTGLYIALIYASYEVDRATALWNLAGEVTSYTRQQLARGDGHAFFTLYGLDRVLAEPEGMTRFTKMVLSTPQGLSVSNVGRVPSVESDPEVDAISFVLCPMPYQSVFSSISTYADRLIINTVYDAGKLADETAQALTNGVHELLLAAAEMRG